MAKTPEGKVKDKVKLLLAKYDIRQAKDAGTFKKAAGWYYFPMQSGFGVKGIPDFIGHYKSYFFGVETKVPGKEPTGFQALQINAIDVSGGAVFVIDGEAGLNEFEQWLKTRR